MILEHARRESFVVSAAVIRAPSVGFTAPIKDALVFICNTRPNPKDFARYDDFTAAQFDGLAASREGGDQHAAENEPALFFSVGRGQTVSKPLPVRRTGRYVVLKLLRADTSAGGDNIDVSFMGLKGHGSTGVGSATGTLK